MRRFKQVHFNTLHTSPANNAVIESNPLQEAMDPRYFPRTMPTEEELQFNIDDLFSF